MRTTTKTSFLLQSLKALFIFLFVYTAVSKFIDFESFNIVLKQSPLIGKAASLVAVLLPSVELMVAALLLIPATVKTGLYAFSFLMILFIGYLSYMLVFSPYLPCTCGGVLKYMSWQHHLLLNALLITLSVVALVLYHRQQQNRFIKK